MFAAAVRTNLWPTLLKSLVGTTVDFEIVFCGPKEPSLAEKEEIKNIVGDWNEFHFLKSGNTKPAQCYEIARRHCKGEVVVWCADDCLFSDDVIGKAYRFWKDCNDKKVILSLITRERYTEKFFLTDLNAHTLKGPNTPLMAPIAMMSREYLEQLGGLDRRYICGQYENSIVMKIYEDGGKLIQFKNCPVVIDHFVGHGGVSTVEGYKRPFAQGYPSDRKVLEGSWIKDGKVSPVQLDKHEPFEDKDLLTKSQSNNIPEMWI